MTENSASEREAWAVFESRLRGYVSRRVDTAAADDVVGDILLRLVQNRDRVGEPGDPLAWVLRVAANAITDHHRRNAAEQRALDRAATEAKIDASAVDDMDGAAADIAACLVSLIRGLPEPYREALLMTDIAGLTQVDAARRLGLSTSGMKSRVQRGRAKLKRAILRCCVVEVDRRGAIVDYYPRKQGCDTGCASKSR